LTASGPRSRAPLARGAIVDARVPQVSGNALAQMMSDHGFDERTASMLMGQAVEYEIANAVDPHFTVVAELRKAHLRAR
jgi:hypothetical protein